MSSSEQLTDAIDKIRSQYGQGAIMSFDTSQVLSHDVLSSGIVSLDKALGVGGFPRGKIVEIYGGSNLGKTTLALHTVAQTQRDGGFAAYIDVENALDPLYAQQLGVDLNSFLISQPDSAEQALNIIEMLLTEQAVDLIILDSVAALCPQAEIDGEMGDTGIDYQARLMSQAMRKLTPLANKTDCVLLFLNQLRDLEKPTLGHTMDTPGGKALKFAASLRLEVSGGNFIRNEQEEAIGRETIIKVVKNKVAPPFTKCSVDNIFGEGLSPVRDVVKLACKMGIVEKSGDWYSYDGVKIGNGLADVRAHLLNKQEILIKIEREIRRL